MNMKCRLALVFTLVFVTAVPLLSNAQPVIEDFESYADTTALQTTWLYDAVFLDSTTPSNGGGAKSARVGRSFLNDGVGALTERLLSPTLDLSGQSVYVWMRRDPTSVSPLELQFWVSSGGSQCGAYLELSDTNWHLVSLNVDVTCPWVTSASIDTIQLVIMNHSGSDGQAWGNFDDITTDGSVPVQLNSFTVE